MEERYKLPLKEVTKRMLKDGSKMTSSFTKEVLEYGLKGSLQMYVLPSYIYDNYDIINRLENGLPSKITPGKVMGALIGFSLSVAQAVYYINGYSSNDHHEEARIIPLVTNAMWAAYIWGKITHKRIIEERTSESELIKIAENIINS